MDFSTGRADRLGLALVHHKHRSHSMKNTTLPLLRALLGLVLVSDAIPSTFAAADLWIRDDVNDVGNEPNTQSTLFYLSDDIWVRRLADPNYDPRPFPCNSPT